MDDIQQKILFKSPPDSLNIYNSYVCKFRDNRISSKTRCHIQKTMLQINFKNIRTFQQIQHTWTIQKHTANTENKSTTQQKQLTTQRKVNVLPDAHSDYSTPTTDCRSVWHVCCELLASY